MAVGTKLEGSKTDQDGTTVSVKVSGSDGSEQVLTVVTEIAAKVAHSIKQGEFRARFQQLGGVASEAIKGDPGLFSGPNVGEFRIDTGVDGRFGLYLITADGGEYYFHFGPEAVGRFIQRLSASSAS